MEPFIPGWAIQFIMRQGMARIFKEMKVVARQMAENDPSSPHVQRKQSHPAAAEFIARKMECHLQQQRPTSPRA